ncbi:Fic family protein [Echinicola shivajiensis]|uniref:hypothetical protein n=1 Tax=Echinicola shivajiensis TaxID=1035916 RepID=UPI001BFC5619|nr:hypothetical protein [Echinicola shivajiensis]
MLINDFTFFSSRLEDDQIKYGETIQFLNNEMVRKGKMKSLLDVANHKDTLQGIIDHIETFECSEEVIKDIHRKLMSSELVWETDFKPELIGCYRNIPTIGYRQPLYPNKEYAPHYNLEMIMGSYVDVFKESLTRLTIQKTKSIF